jgi:hypothetical protein
VRGARASLPARKSKAELVLVAARYGDDGRLDVARGYARHDQVWSDVRLIDRDTLVDLLRSDRRVATAVVEGLGADFSLQAPVELRQTNGRDQLLAKGSSAPNDDLGLPLF